MCLQMFPEGRNWNSWLDGSQDYSRHKAPHVLRPRDTFQKLQYSFQQNLLCFKRVEDLRKVSFCDSYQPGVWWKNGVENWRVTCKVSNSTFQPVMLHGGWHPVRSQSINQTSIAPISPVKPGSVVWSEIKLARTDTSADQARGKPN